MSLYEALHTIPALELGLPVVGSFGRADDGGSLMRVDFLRDVLGRDGRAEGIVGTGPLGGLDLEKLRALQPDLILASELNVQMLGQLEKIAPTYVLHTRATQTSGFESQEKLARLTGATRAWPNCTPPIRRGWPRCGSGSSRPGARIRDRQPR